MGRRRARGEGRELWGAVGGLWGLWEHWRKLGRGVQLLDFLGPWGRLCLGRAGYCQRDQSLLSCSL